MRISRQSCHQLHGKAANPNASNRGVTAYTLLVREGCQQLVERVLDYGAEPVH